MKSKKKKILRAIDEKMLVLTEKLSDETLSYDDRINIEEQLDVLVDYRTKLDDKQSGQLAPVILAGLFNLLSVLLILNYEKADIITTKAYSLIKK